jgi:uncharacterized protein (DUF488 family)
MKKIYTIGYEGASLEDFIATLQLLKINKLIDVREFAISRKKGFSKTALNKALELSEISYQHEKRLGSPKEIRHRLREDKNYSKYFKDFNCYLETQQSLLESLAKDDSNRVVLMCYERDSNICHRSVVSEKIGELLGIRPEHIGVQKHEVRKFIPGTGKTLDISEGVSPA